MELGANLLLTAKQNQDFPSIKKLHNKIKSSILVFPANYFKKNHQVELLPQQGEGEDKRTLGEY